MQGGPGGDPQTQLQGRGRPGKQQVDYFDTGKLHFNSICWLKVSHLTGNRQINLAIQKM